MANKFLRNLRAKQLAKKQLKKQEPEVSTENEEMGAEMGSSELLFETKANIQNMMQRYKKYLIFGGVAIVSIPLALILMKAIQKNKQTQPEGSMSKKKLTANEVDAIGNRDSEPTDEEMDLMVDYFEDFVDQLDAEKADPKIEVIPPKMEVFAFDEKAFDELLPEDELPINATKQMITADDFSPEDFEF